MRPHRGGGAGGHVVQRGAAPAASDIEEAKELLQEHEDNIEQKIEDIDAQIAELEAKRENLVQQHPRIN